MLSAKQFIVQNADIAFLDAIALWMAIACEDELPVRQLLREFESSYPPGYGKQLSVKTLAFLTDNQKHWLRSLY
jgi:hypothetical protein